MILIINNQIDDFKILLPDLKFLEFENIILF